jgi:adenine/guanine phosphoribosyltransferase-like PRPP-binding protein
MNRSAIEIELKRILREESKFSIPLHNAVYAETIALLNLPLLKLLEKSGDAKITKVVSMESTGLMFGCPVALALSLPLVTVLKAERIKSRTMAAVSDSYVGMTLNVV